MYIYRGMKNRTVTGHMLKISTALFFVCVLTACDMFFKPKSIFASIYRPDVQAV